MLSPRPWITFFFSRTPVQTRARVTAWEERDLNDSRDPGLPLHAGIAELGGRPASLLLLPPPPHRLCAWIKCVGIPSSPPVAPPCPMGHQQAAGSFLPPFLLFFIGGGRHTCPVCTTAPSPGGSSPPHGQGACPRAPDVHRLGAAHVVPSLLPPPPFLQRSWAARAAALCLPPSLTCLGLSAPPTTTHRTPHRTVDPPLPLSALHRPHPEGTAAPPALGRGGWELRI